jgi:DNA mismatch endonuclease, patch repair protein
MRAIKRTGTKPEEALRRALHRLGYRYRKDHRIDLSGGVRVRPDIVFTARKVAVFVDGCFWHVCPEHGRQPTVNEWYWAPKLRRTMERDRAADVALTAAGWRVVRLWEHVPLDQAKAAVIEALGFTPGALEAGEPAAGAARSVPAQALAEIPRQASHHEVTTATREGGHFPSCNPARLAHSDHLETGGPTSPG